MFSVIHMDASGDDDPSPGTLSALYDKLSRTGIVDGNVSVISQDSGWCLSAHRDGAIVFEHVKDGGERHMRPVEKERVIELWLRLIAGDLDGILAEPWKPGYVSNASVQR